MTQKVYIDMFIGVGTLLWSHYENSKSETTFKSHVKNQSVEIA